MSAPDPGDGDAAPFASEPHSKVDEERLGAWMDHEGLPGEGLPVTARFITGGASNDLFEIVGVSTASPSDVRPSRSPRAATRRCCASTGCSPHSVAPTSPTQGSWQGATTARCSAAAST